MADIAYRLKQVSYGGRQLPVVLQNENGPCPLLAIANVLLLRNQISLPLGPPDVSQDRLISLVAGYLLDCSSDQKLAASQQTEEYKANMQQNVADSITFLPKLTTGLDVNVKFHDIRSFEFTDEVAIFDLLGINLVHGWLIDPQDRQAAAAVGDMGYNQLVERLIAITGEATPKSFRRTRSRHSTGSLSTSGVGLSSRPQTGDNPDASAAAQPLSSAQRPQAQASHQAQPASPSQQPAASHSHSQSADDDAELLSQALALSLSMDCAPLAQAAEADAPPAAQAHPAQAAAGVHEAPSPRSPESDAWQMVQNPLLPWASSAPPAAQPQYQHDAAQAPAAGLLDQPQQHSPDLAPSTPSDASALTHAPAQATPASQASPSPAPHADEPAGHPSEPAHLPPDVEQSDEEAILLLQQSISASSAAGAAPAMLPETALLSQIATRQPQMAADGLVGPLSPHTLLGMADAAEPGTGADAFQVSKAASTGLAPGEQTDTALRSEDTATPPTHFPSAPTPAPSLRDSTSVPSTPGQAAAAEGKEDVSAARAKELAVAEVLHQFLECSQGQLTAHGLVSLQEGLKDNQLAVFFRNNHFNLLLKRGSALYILVTDQGYLYEQDVVWERLSGVDGNTEFVDASFTSFHGRSVMREALEAARLAQDAFRDVVPSQATRNSTDADLALAMQLQEQESQAADARRQALAQSGASTSRQSQSARGQEPQRSPRSTAARQQMDERRRAAVGKGRPAKDDKSCTLM